VILDTDDISDCFTNEEAYGRKIRKSFDVYCLFSRIGKRASISFQAISFVFFTLKDSRRVFFVKVPQFILSITFITQADNSKNTDSSDIITVLTSVYLKLALLGVTVVSCVVSIIIYPCLRSHISKKLRLSSGESFNLRSYVSFKIESEFNLIVNEQRETYDSVEPHIDLSEPTSPTSVGPDSDESKRQELYKVQQAVAKQAAQRAGTNQSGTASSMGSFPVLSPNNPSQILGYSSYPSSKSRPKTGATSLIRPGAISSDSDIPITYQPTFSSPIPSSPVVPSTSTPSSLTSSSPISSHSNVSPLSKPPPSPRNSISSVPLPGQTILTHACVKCGCPIVFQLPPTEAQAKVACVICQHINTVKR